MWNLSYFWGKWEVVEDIFSGDVTQPKQSFWKMNDIKKLWREKLLGVGILTRKQLYSFSCQVMTLIMIEARKRWKEKTFMSIFMIGYKG